MNLLSVKRELAQLKALSRNRVGSGCVCEYVEVVDGQEMTPQQEQTLTRNRECYELHNERNVHVGFSCVTIPAER